MNRRRTTTAITLSVLVIILCAMAAYGFQKATAPIPHDEDKAAAAPACSEQEKEVKKSLARRDVQVSVYNAGGRAGLAGRTMDKVEAAGFVGGDIGNAPGTAGQVRRAVVWTTTPDDPAARLVALAVGRGTQVKVTTEELGPGVDLLVGDRFKGLDPKAARQIRLSTPIETCVQVD